MTQLIFIKLGGGLITDKSRPLTLRQKNIEHLAREISRVQQEHPGTQIIIGNGAGSFGHYTVQEYLEPAKNGQEKYYAVGVVAHSVRRLNDRIVEELLKNNVSAFSIAPSSVIGRSDFYTVSIENLLEHDMVPVIYGDIVATDSGGRVFSTEELFLMLAKKLKRKYQIARVIYVTSKSGVLDDSGRVIPKLNEAEKVGQHKNEKLDVTGGMAAKVKAAQGISKLADRVYIIGAGEGELLRAVNGEDAGTLISA